MTVDCAVIQRESPFPGTRHRRIEGPVRTCIGCRERTLAVELLRMVAVSSGDGQLAVAVDSAGSLHGRGAWLHSDERCLEAAIRRRAFTRALRITGSPDTSAVVEQIHLCNRPATEQVAKNMSTP